MLLSVEKLDQTPSTESPITATITGNTDATDITDLDALNYIGSVVATTVQNIDGAASDVVAALTALGDGAPENFSSALTGAASAAHISTINGANGTGSIDLALPTSLALHPQLRPQLPC